MLDTNVLISAAVLSSKYIVPLLDELAEHHTIGIVNICYTRTEARYERKVSE